MLLLPTMELLCQLSCILRCEKSAIYSLGMARQSVPTQMHQFSGSFIPTMPCSLPIMMYWGPLSILSWQFRNLQPYMLLADSSELGWFCYFRTLKQSNWTSGQMLSHNRDSERWPAATQQLLIWLLSQVYSDLSVHKWSNLITLHNMLTDILTQIMGLHMCFYRTAWQLMNLISPHIMAYI